MPSRFLLDLDRGMLAERAGLEHAGGLDHRCLLGPVAPAVLQRLLGTARYLLDGTGGSMALGGSRPAEPHSEMDAHGRQILAWQRGSLQVCLLRAPWYLDAQSCTRGPIDTVVPREALGCLAEVGVVEAETAAILQWELSLAFPGVPLRASHIAEHHSDWPGVNRAVCRQPDWRAEPTLLRCHARALERLRRCAEALGVGMLLCWSHPKQASVIAAEAGAVWRTHWRDFLGAARDGLSAWLLIRRPGLAARLSPETRQASTESVHLVAARASGDRAVQASRSLKAIAPKLFQHYLATAQPAVAGA